MQPPQQAALLLSSRRRASLSLASIRTATSSRSVLAVSAARAARGRWLEGAVVGLIAVEAVESRQSTRARSACADPTRRSACRRTSMMAPRAPQHLNLTVAVSLL